MFDPRSYATDGLYPGLVTTMAVANQGSFLDRIVAAVKKVIVATTDAYTATKTSVQEFILTATAAADIQVLSSVTTNKISAFATETKAKVSTVSKNIVASADNYRGKVRTTKKKSIKVE